MVLGYIENLTCFADDKFPLVRNRNKLDLVRNYVEQAKEDNGLVKRLGYES